MTKEGARSRTGAGAGDASGRVGLNARRRKCGSDLAAAIFLT